MHSFTVDIEARGLKNVAVIRIWRSVLQPPVAKLYRKPTEADSTGRAYCNLYDRL